MDNTLAQILDLLQTTLVANAQLREQVQQLQAAYTDLKTQTEAPAQFVGAKGPDDYP